jgi:hypothetical protein
MISSDMTWSVAAACVGSYANTPVLPLMDADRALNGVRSDVLVRLPKLGARLRGMQRIQATHGRSVSFETSPIAPKAHKDATEAGVSGPYPWRRPV